MRSSASPEAIASVAAACALEGAWVTLAYVTVESLAREARPPLSLLAFGVATLVGLGFARWAAGRPQTPYGGAIAGIVIVVALAGWLIPTGAAVGDLVSQPFVALQQHPGGLLLGLAVLRGTAHVTPEDDERIAEFALSFGLAAIAAVWIVLAATSGTAEAWVAEIAFLATVTFVAAALVSLGLARLAGLEDANAVGADRRTGVVLFGVVAILLAVSLPLAVVLGVPLDAALRGGLGPVADLVGLILPILLLPAALIATLLVTAFQFLTGGGHLEQPPALPDPGSISEQLGRLVGSGGASVPAVGLITLLGATVAAVLLIRALIQRPADVGLGRGFVETRDVERPVSVRLPSLRRPFPVRHRPPGSASEAYVASLAVLATSPELARRSSETPAEHASRIAASAAGPVMRRLAADYALARFGRRAITAAEHRRAIERWRRLRTLVR